MQADNQIVEVYFMDGRVAMTLIVPAARGGGVVLGTRGANTTASAKVWGMGAIF
jgi:hypothetical protein